MSAEKGIQALTALGFSGLEAEVYTFLLQESPATGYRIAQALGKAAANVYKVLESLEAKGAVLVDDGATRLVRATPAEELLSKLERNFQERRARAALALAQVPPSPSDDRVYQLKTREQVFARCRSMLARSEKLVLCDLFPDPLEVLRADLEATAARGVDVTVKTFLPAVVEGVNVVLNGRGQDVINNYPGQWMILLVDGREMLVASLAPNRKDVQQAIWSSSVSLSWILHASFAAELMLFILFHHIQTGATREDLRAAIAPFMQEGRVEGEDNTSEVVAEIRHCQSFFAKTLPGYEALITRFRGNRESEKETTERDERT